jgi:site-specific DNA recombinase
MKAGASFKDIAKQISVDQRHIARTIRLAFLAPDITEAILTWNAPQDMNTDNLLRLKTLPVDWETSVKNLVSFRPTRQNSDFNSKNT